MRLNHLLKLILNFQQFFLNRCPNSQGLNYENKVYPVLWEVYVHILKSKPKISRIHFLPKNEIQ